MPSCSRSRAGLLALFASLDVILFYIFFEFSLIPLFFLIGIWGGSERRQAAVTFFLYTLAGSLLTLLGVIALVVIHYQYSPSHTLTFSIPELTQGLAALDWAGWKVVAPWSASPQVLIFLLLFAGFAIKVPLFPFHTWLPLAHVEAPAAGSILLAGVLLKVGTYGLVRFNLSMTPLGAQVLFPLLATLAVVGIIYGALVALAQTDIKRLVAYSSVSHMGFIALGLFSLNATGIEGAVIQMVNHGITTGALFACVGLIYERYHTREMSELGGLWERLPLLAFFLIMASLGSAAVPGLNGFVGEFPILVGMFARCPRTTIFAATGMILGAYYLLLMLQRVVFGSLHEPHHGDDPHHARRPACGLARDRGADPADGPDRLDWGLSPTVPRADQSCDRADCRVGSPARSKRGRNPHSPTSRYRVKLSQSRFLTRFPTLPPGAAVDASSQFLRDRQADALDPRAGTHPPARGDGDDDGRCLRQASPARLVWACRWIHVGRAIRLVRTGGIRRSTSIRRSP